MIAVIGASDAAAKTAAMPTKPYAAAGPVQDGNAWCANAPNPSPKNAPVNKDGANTPPEPPPPSVREVAKGFSTDRVSACAAGTCE